MRWSIILSFILSLLVAVGLGVLAFGMNEWFLTTPDAGGLACGADTLANTKQFSDGQTGTLGYNFNICWTKETYPGVQIINALALKILPFKTVDVVMGLIILVYVGCVLGMCFIGWQLTRSPLSAGLAGVLAAASPALLRSVILTPQNVYGYFLIILLLIGIIHIVQTKRYWWWLAILPLPVLLVATHTLSFGLAAIICALWFWLIYIEGWRYRLILGISAVIGVGGLYKFMPKFSSIIQHALNLFQSNFAGYDHPWWDHPAIWGYIITALAAVGIVLTKQLHYKIKWLLLLFIIVPTAFGHLSVLGFTLLPERFIPFAWIGLVVFAALGMSQLQQQLKLSPSLFIPLVLLLGSAQVIHAMVYIKDDVDGWSARFRPHAEFTTAVEWLNNANPHGTLLGIMAVSNREITFAPLWYQGTITSYPWYNLNHRNIKSFTAKSALYQPIVADPAHPEYQRVFGLYNIITKPNSPEAINYATIAGINYFIMPKSSQAYKIWTKAQPAQFPLLYENNAYSIYVLKP